MANVLVRQLSQIWAAVSIIIMMHQNQSPSIAVVHIVPKAVFSNCYHGSYKDTISRVRFLEERAAEYRQLRIDGDDVGFVLKELAGTQVSSVLIEYSLFPKIVKAIRQQYPRSFIAVRSHNLEPLQHFDNHGWWPQQGPLWMAYGMVRLLQNDFIVKRYASTVWPISDWERRVYWDRLPGRAEVRWLPYHCPQHLLSDSGMPFAERRRIVCMPTSQKNPKSWDLVTRFIQFAEALSPLAGDRYEFLITGNLTHWDLPFSNAVRYTGMIDDLQAFLPTIKTVALLSPKGYGFKTTVGDAIAAGANVVMHPTLATRYPTAVQPAIARVDTNRIPDLESVLQQIEKQPDVSALDAECANLTETILGSLLSP
jgi:hypothetical protein